MTSEGGRRRRKASSIEGKKDRRGREKLPQQHGGELGIVVHNLAAGAEFALRRAAGGRRRGAGSRRAGGRRRARLCHFSARGGPREGGSVTT